MMVYKKLTLAASSAVLLAGGVAVYALREQGRAREAAFAAVRDRDDLQARLKAAEQAVAAANERLSQARLQAESLKEDLGRLFPQKSPASPSAITPQASSTSTLLSPTPTVRPIGSPSDLRSGSTMFVAGRYRGPRTSFVRNPPSLKSLDTIYPALYRQLNLSPAQSAQFKILAIEVADRFSDLDRRAKAERKRPSDPTMQPLYAAVDAEYRQKLVALVGADAIPTIESFAETLFLRDAVAYLAGELFHTDAPLQQSQADQLVEVMSKNLRDPTGRLDTVFADAAVMKTAAGEFLSPVQLAAWVQFIDDLAKTNFGALQPRGQR